MEILECPFQKFDAGTQRIDRIVIETDLSVCLFELTDQGGHFITGLHEETTDDRECADANGKGEKKKLIGMRECMTHLKQLLSSMMKQYH